MPARKIGLFGGTFNPIHNGHINICLEAIKELGLDIVFVIPNRIPPHKEMKDFNNYDFHRINMIKLAIQNYPKLKLLTYELKSNDVSYTYKTIEEIKKLLPDDDLYYIIGDDSFFNFHKWVKPEIISKYAKIVVGKRNKINEDFFEKQKLILENNFATKVLFLKNKICDVSSTNIRDFIDNEDLKFVDKNVLKYIKDNNLYGRI